MFLKVKPSILLAESGKHNLAPSLESFECERATAAGKFLREGTESCAPICGKLIVAHAKVYTFAGQSLFPELQMFSLLRLEQVLNLAERQPNSLLPELIEAVHHIDEKTIAPDPYPEPAIKMLTRFLAHNLESLQNDFGSLASESREIELDMLRETLSRLTMAGRESMALTETIQDLENKSARKSSTIKRLKKNCCRQCTRTFGVYGVDTADSL